MARKTGAALIPLFCVQADGWTYRAVFEKPIEQQLTDDRDRDIAETTQRYARIFETYVKRHPDHWMFWEEFREGHLVQPDATVTTALCGSNQP